MSINQASTIGFGSDANVLAGYALAANDRLGNIQLTVENTGANSLYLQIRERTAGASPSGYANLGAAITVVPKGVQTLNLNLVSAQIGFFGSGNTTASISTVLRNSADRRGAQIDIVSVGRQGWGYAAGASAAQFRSPYDKEANNVDPLI